MMIICTYYKLGIETATAALKELNGTILSEKPVIIQYSSSH